MEMIEKKIGDNTYTFQCEYVDSRDGFSHVCKLYKNDYTLLNSARRHYINRTWEAYTYQSVMLDCVRNEMDYIMQNAIDEYKKEHNLVRLKGSRKESVVEAVKNSKEYAEMNMLYDMVYKSKYGTEAEREKLESLDKLLKLTEALFGKDGLLRKEA